MNILLIILAAVKSVADLLAGWFGLKAKKQKAKEPGVKNQIKSEAGESQKKPEDLSK